MSRDSHDHTAVARAEGRVALLRTRLGVSREPLPLNMFTLIALGVGVVERLVRMLQSADREPSQSDLRRSRGPTGRWPARPRY
jgi:hypothetical protein